MPHSLINEKQAWDMFLKAIFSTFISLSLHVWNKKTKYISCLNKWFDWGMTVEQGKVDFRAEFNQAKVWVHIWLSASLTNIN